MDTRGGVTILGERDIRPISKTGASDLLVEQILGFVKAGRLKPGDKLPSERDLAERFEVSRPTVREAMRALSVLGIVEIRHGGGAFVTALRATELLGPLNFFLSLSEVSIEKLYEARRLIEGEICALAASRVDAAFCAELEAMIERQEAVKENGGRPISRADKPLPRASCPRFFGQPVPRPERPRASTCSASSSAAPRR